MSTKKEILSTTATNLRCAVRRGENVVIAGGIFNPKELATAAAGLDERSKAFEFLNRILRDDQNATQTWQAKQEARAWLAQVDQ
jgi:hypothetical protein